MPAPPATPLSILGPRTTLEAQESSGPRDVILAPLLVCQATMPGAGLMPGYMPCAGPSLDEGPYWMRSFDSLFCTVIVEGVAGCHTGPSGAANAKSL